MIFQIKNIKSCRLLSKCYAERVTDGVNVLLAGIGMELGVSILFTPEESG